MERSIEPESTLRSDFDSQISGSSYDVLIGTFTCACTILVLIYIYRCLQSLYKKLSRMKNRRDKIVLNNIVSLIQLSREARAQSKELDHAGNHAWKNAEKYLQQEENESLARRTLFGYAECRVLMAKYDEIAYRMDRISKALRLRLLKAPTGLNQWEDFQPYVAGVLASQRNPDLLMEKMTELERKLFGSNGLAHESSPTDMDSEFAPDSSVSDVHSQTLVEQVERALVRMRANLR